MQFSFDAFQSELFQLQTKVAALYFLVTRKLNQQSQRNEKYDCTDTEPTCFTMNPDFTLKSEMKNDSS